MAQTKKCNFCHETISDEDILNPNKIRAMVSKKGTKYFHKPNCFNNFLLGWEAGAYARMHKSETYEKRLDEIIQTARQCLSFINNNDLDNNDVVIERVKSFLRRIVYE